MDERKALRAAWREPMVWLVFAIPALAIVFTVTLLVVASRSSGTNDAVAARVQRTAQVQVADLGPDATARQLGLIAAVRKYDLEGVRLDTVRLVPQGTGWIPFRGEQVRAIRLTVTDPSHP